MDCQAVFSSKDKSKNNKSVICCNFAPLSKGEDKDVKMVQPLHPVAQWIRRCRAKLAVPGSKPAFHPYTELKCTMTFYIILPWVQ